MKMDDDIERIEDMIEEAVSPQVMGAIDLIGRTGAKWTQIRYSDEEEPVVWIAVAGYASHDDGDGPVQVGAGLDPEGAYMALCKVLIDGGLCRHCARTTVFIGMQDRGLSVGNACRTEWSPERQKFTQSCGGRKAKEATG